jgi:hypothetical protein
MKISWDQPHEGNLFEFLYKRRAIDRKKVGEAGLASNAVPAASLNRPAEKIV